MSEHPYKTGGIIISSVVGINAVWQYFQTGEIDAQKLVETGIVATVGIGIDRATDIIISKVAKIDDITNVAKVAKAADVAGDTIKTADAVSDVAGSAVKTVLPITGQIASEVATDLAIYSARMGFEYAAGADISREQVIDRLGIAAKYYGIAATASAGIGAGIGAIAGAIAGLPAGGVGAGPGAAAGAYAGAKFGTLVLYNTGGNWWAEKKIEEEIHEKILEEVNEALASDDDFARLSLLAGEEFDRMILDLY